MIVNGTTAVGKPNAFVEDASKPSVYCTSVGFWMVAESDWDTFAVPATAAVFKRSLKVYEPPPEIWKPVLVAAEVGKYHVTVPPLVLVVTVEVASPAATTLLPFWSISKMFEVDMSVVVAVAPERVIVNLSNATGPALFAEKVTVPKSSVADFARFEVAPKGDVKAVSVERKTVIVLPEAPLTEATVVGLLEVAPNAITLAGDAM